MEDIPPTDRAFALLQSPAGSALLMMITDGDLAITDLSQPAIGLAAINQAVAAIRPWHGAGQACVRRALFAWREAHRSRLETLALAIVSQPGIDWWWSGVDRDHQLWLPQHDAFICPEEVWELRPRDKPNQFERYVHEPRPLVSTSNRYGDLSPELVHVLLGCGDWSIERPFPLRQVQIRPTARILEIGSAQEWHDLVRRYPADGYHSTYPDEKDQPWGDAPGLMVPDWRQASFDWDGVHISPWTYLVANKVRVSSEIGWTEPWAWQGPHTVWLDWVFDAVEDLPPVEASASEHLPWFSVPALDFSEPDG